METRDRPRRSTLYVPGSNPRALEKSRQLSADSLILDLEDAVAPDAKDTARGNICSQLADGGFGKREVLVRINALDSPWGETDLEAISATGPDAIVLPKVESAATVQHVAQYLGQSPHAEGMAIWCMIETPRGVLRAEEIADAHPRLAGFIMGTSDLVNDLHAAHTGDRLPLLPALGMCLLAARAAGLAIIDGVHLDLADAEGFQRACEQGKAMGFDGKSLIHPKTIETANTCFSPSEAEIEFARRVIEAHDQAIQSGSGITVLDGKLIENLHVRDAQRVLALHAAIN